MFCVGVEALNMGTSFIKIQRNKNALLQDKEGLSSSTFDKCQNL